MAYTCDRPHFTVTVSSAFVSEWQWAVHAVVHYRTAGTAGIRKAIEAEARLELMIGISNESRLGRERGARTVVVFVEGDREVGGSFRQLEMDAQAPRVA